MIASYTVEAVFKKRYSPFKGFPGTTLRGAFGVALRRILCDREGASCRRCARYNDCIYSRMFESSSIISPSVEVASKGGLEGVTNPYTVEVLHTSSTKLRFRLNLFGEALEWEPQVLVALVGMGMEGLGIDPAKLERRKFEIVRIVREVELGSGEEVYTASSGFVNVGCKWRSRGLLEVFEDHARRIVEARPRRILLAFKSPYRLVRKGRFVLKPRFPTVLMNLARRYTLLAAYHKAGRPLAVSEARRLKRIALSAELESYEITSRVRVTKIGVEGARSYGTFVLGTLTYAIPQSFWEQGEALLATELLLLGEYLHVGKLASAGYGDYELYYR